MIRLKVVALTCAAVMLPVSTASAETVQSIQKFTAEIEARDPVHGNGSLLSTTYGFIKGLGLDEQVTVKLYALPSGAGATMLITGESPLIIREIAPVTLARDVAPFDSRLEMSVPRNLQSPAPGVIASMVTFPFRLPAQASACSGSWSARYEADYTTTYDSAHASSQTVATSAACAGSPTGPVWVSVRSYFDDIGPDLGREVQFATIKARFFLPMHLGVVMQTTAGCAANLVFQDERLCPVGQPPQPSPPPVSQPTPTGGAPVPVTPEVKPLRRFTALFGTQSRRRGKSRSGPIGQLRSLAGFTSIPVRSRVHVSCVRGCRSQLRKSFVWHGRPVSLKLTLLKSTVISVGVTTPSGATRSQLYRFVSTRMGVVPRSVSS